MAQNHIRHRKRQINPLYSSDTDPSCAEYSRKKLGSLTCCICGGASHGYNFDAITCESCKAFFRRNALRKHDEFKCRMNTGKCTITVSTRKRCKACRLAKCLEQGMRADWILTDEERVNKRRKIEENRQLRQTIYPDSSDTDEIRMAKTSNKKYNHNSEEHDDDNSIEPLSSSSSPSPPSPSPPSPSVMSSSKSLLSSENLIKIQTIQQAYVDSVRLISLPSQLPLYPQLVRLTEPSDMINLHANIHATRLIAYFKLLPEFSSLNEYDKLVLIKYNTFPLSFIRAALTYDMSTDTYHEPNTDDCIFSGKDLIQCFGLHQYEQSTRCVRNFVNASSNDRLLLEMFLIIMLFSKGASICTYKDEAEPTTKNSLQIFKMQNLFVDLLWKYCLNKFGYLKCINIWLQLTTSSMDAHFQASKTRHDYIKVDSVATQLLPLMKSVMLII